MPLGKREYTDAGKGMGHGRDEDVLHSALHLGLAASLGRCGPVC